MSAVRRLVLTLSFALALAAPAAAQADGRVSLNATVGPSFASVGTTFSTVTGLDMKLNERTSVVGEFGVLPRAPFREAAEIAAPATGPDSRVNAYHWNANLKLQPVRVRKLAPYLTGGVGSFTSDTVLNDVTIGVTRFEDHRRTTNFATNVGAGANYRLKDWVGIGADYRTFFVHRDEQTPRVHRVTAGVTFSLK